MPISTPARPRQRRHDGDDRDRQRRRTLDAGGAAAGRPRRGAARRGAADRSGDARGALRRADGARGMSSAELALLIRQMSVLALPAIFAITFHEAAHGFVAYQLGDDTAWRMGRVTFNPLRHIDLVGTILIPLVLFFTTGFLFGYAKSVTVSVNQLRPPRIDMAWVALAGPVTNIILAIASALLLYLLPYVPAVVNPWLRAALLTSTQFTT